jgi:hypothetical protein
VLVTSRYCPVWRRQEQKKTDAKVMQKIQEYVYDNIHVPEEETPPDNATVVIRRFGTLSSLAIRVCIFVYIYKQKCLCVCVYIYIYNLR